MKFKCEICGKESKCTNPTYRAIRTRNNRCKDCIYHIGIIHPGIVWYHD